MYRLISRGLSGPTVRTAVTNHKIIVTFTRILKVVLESTSVLATADSNIDVAIVDDVMLDPATHKTFVKIQTYASEPYPDFY